MIKKLHIQNYALINNLDLVFNKGLNVITGETGAGKSILVGALGLILGNRADIKIVSSYGNKCIIEGIFDSSSKSVISFLKKNELDIDNELNIRREINKNGKSRAFVNDTPVSLTLLKELSSALVDVNSQNQSYIFKNSEFQLSILDDLSDVDSILSDYKFLYAEYKSNQKILSRLEDREMELLKHKDFIQFQFDELNAANLISGEEDELNSQLELMDNAELIKQALFNVTQTLSQGDNTVIEQIEFVLSQLSPLNKFHRRYQELQQRLESVLIEIQDITSEYGNLFEESDFDPQQHIVLKERNDFLYRLLQKHRKSSIDDLIALMNDFDNELNSMESISEEIAELKVKLHKMEKSLNDKAQNLSNKRHKAVKNIENKIEKTLHLLGMKDAIFSISIKKLDTLNENGFDGVDFLFSSNKGHEPDLISKIASGGELSRLVLSLKALYSSNKALPTVIFDEIDTGVSGDIASKVGHIMKEMSKNMQVIAITHLPQIAAKSDWHYKVFKNEVNGVTQSNIHTLTEKESIEEIALMISGDSSSEQAIKMASELRS